MVVTKDVDFIVYSLVSRMNLYNRYRAQRELALVTEQILQKTVDLTEQILQKTVDLTEQILQGFRF